MKEIVLASSSPRRRDLLKQLGLTFRIMTAGVDETPPGGLTPAEMVEVLAGRKAAAVAGMLEDALVIGADTVVVLNGRVLGKPADREEAAGMLRQLQGTDHTVYTGVAVMDAASKKMQVAHEKTRVFFKSLDEHEIRRYVATGEPMGKAGAYAVQGRAAAFIKGLEGCYTNVVGLPLARLADMLKKFGYNVL
ncbi:MAG: septum formation inhibitor Maf [Pelotomaculum sp.]|uniref:dTTP/UTP pyrophosphatase n=1 Tax=Pelotomaculum thermopropionicum (strain DSM 13744 / JCM 10971 / SI) TaxID=370438 RepID=NTPPA_PELTS|nr:RecName: Full=dTTP/UTP pyrophosphatase; Short=dTTPase/UTPase; AltName: Full=Nucleoside triphosphate pyrophosphatase; AltName: Full=Nucleotide pyrophosphatase; Short=Nucleotide PPase [Pelotomaculum thermopropionicum SI]NPV73842.1 septum formation inhibitor Maf [Pelotomaculum sp.]BAF58996.1 nucleotide-binding protein [Pelotomaculum thermopropionicum SI]